MFAGPTRLELATSCVTGRRSNQAELRPRALSEMEPSSPERSRLFGLSRRTELRPHALSEIEPSSPERVPLLLIGTSRWATPCHCSPGIINIPNPPCICKTFLTQRKWSRWEPSEGHQNVPRSFARPDTISKGASFSIAQTAFRFRSRHHSHLTCKCTLRSEATPHSIEQCGDPQSVHHLRDAQPLSQAHHTP